MRDVKVDRDQPIGLHEQVAGEIKRAIAEGGRSRASDSPGKGSRRHPRRQRQHGAHTLRMLRDEGLLEFRRGRGVTVAGTPERGAVTARARGLVEFARRQGYRVDELVGMIRRSLDDRTRIRARGIATDPLIQEARRRARRRRLMADRHRRDRVRRRGVPALGGTRAGGERRTPGPPPAFQRRADDPLERTPGRLGVRAGRGRPGAHRLPVRTGIGVRGTREPGVVARRSRGRALVRRLRGSDPEYRAPHRRRRDPRGPADPVHVHPTPGRLLHARGDSRGRRMAPRSPTAAPTTRPGACSSCA